MVRTKLLEEAEGLRESSEESVPLLLVVVEEEDEDIIKTRSWIDLLTIGIKKHSKDLFGAYEEMFLKSI